MWQDLKSLPWPTLITNAIISLMIAWGATRLTAKHALQRFRSEKWWERKSAAYVSAVEALHHLLRAIENEVNHLNADAEIDPLKYLPKYIETRFQCQLAGVYTAVDTAPFLLSEDASQALRTFQDSIAQCEQDSENENDFCIDYLRAATSALDITKRCLRDVIKYGKIDLNIKVA